MNDKTLRTEVKKLKVYQDIKYKEIAELLEIKESSFYSWLQGRYNFSAERKRHLQAIINDLYFEE